MLRTQCSALGLAIKPPDAASESRGEGMAKPQDPEVEDVEASSGEVRPVLDDLDSGGQKGVIPITHNHALQP
jgi:hypothetical protein